MQPSDPPIGGCASARHNNALSLSRSPRPEPSQGASHGIPPAQPAPSSRAVAGANRRVPPRHRTCPGAWQHSRSWEDSARSRMRLVISGQRTLCSRDAEEASPSRAAAGRQGRCRITLDGLTGAVLRVGSEMSKAIGRSRWALRDLAGSTASQNRFVELGPAFRRTGLCDGLTSRRQRLRRVVREQLGSRLRGSTRRYWRCAQSEPLIRIDLLTFKPGLREARPVPLRHEAWR
jgi:hypothetical protein